MGELVENFRLLCLLPQHASLINILLDEQSHGCCPLRHIFHVNVPPSCTHFQD